MKATQKLFLLTVSVLVLAAGCQKENVQTQPNGNQGDPGSFKVSMTDNPGDFQALNMEVVRIEAYMQNRGWVTLSSETQSFNVLSLTNGAQKELVSKSKGQAELGTYTMLKIVFGSNNRLTINAAAAFNILGLTGVSNALVDLRFEGDKEVILTIDEQVSSTAGAEVLVDFDVAQSIYNDGQEYVIDPVLTVIQDAKTGVRGHVEGAAHAIVQLSKDGDSLSTYINASGDFLIRGAKPGMYEMSVIPEQPSIEQPAPAPYHVHGLVIAEGKITNVGTISF